MNVKIFLLILIATFFYYLPILITPEIILNRNNDLQEFFWPIFYFIKQQVLENKTLPLWNNLFLSGTPLLPDPQSQLFYLPNMIFLLMPLQSAFIVSIIAHSLMGSIGIYLCAKKCFNWSATTSFFIALLYITTPKMAGFLEAGHFGLITSFAWLPFVILSTLMLAKKQRVIWSIMLSICLTAVFFTHIIIFFIAVFSSFIIYTTYLLINAQNSFLSGNKNHKNITKYLLLFLISGIGVFGLTTVVLLPQLEWSGATTRFILLADKEVYPKWTSVSEFFKIVLFPLINGKEGIWQIESEKWLPLGLLNISLSILGFLTLKRKLKFVVLIVVILTGLISLNNASPIYSILLKQDWYVLMRISTRVWFVIIFINIFLAGAGFEAVIKTKRKLAYLLATLAILELSLLSWFYLSKPIDKSKFVPEEIYHFLKNDQEKFRVFCTTRCLSQKKASELNLELIEGYNTIQQLNYYKQAWQLTGGYWNYYTLSIPPIGLYQFEKLQPDPISLGNYNVKYVISPHKLTDENYILKKVFGDYIIYQNNLFLPRAYFWKDEQKPGKGAPILKYTPNQILVDTSAQETKRLVLSEVYSQGWVAYLNGKSKVPVQQKSDALRLVDIKPDTELVDFKYQPESFKIGMIITIATYLFMISMLTAFYVKNKTNFTR